MLFEILLVFLIIAFSYIFKVSGSIGMDNQLTFICLTFIVVILYKMLLYYRMKNNLSKVSEGFYDFSKEVNEFVSSGLPEKVNNQNIQEYKENLNKLQEQVNVMNEYLQEISSIAKGENEFNKTPLDEINIQASQQIQDYRIKKLQEDITQTTDLIKKAKLRDDAKSFKKIPVYSSCVVSNADGSFSVDSPSTSTGMTSGTAANTNGVSNLENRVMSALSSNTPNVGNTPNSPNSGNRALVGATGSSSVPASNNNLNLGDVLKHIQDKGITLNLDARGN